MYLIHAFNDLHAFALLSLFAALRLACVCVMKEPPNAFNLVAPDCGSWSVVSRGTSQRSAINPLGRQGIPFVQRGNGTISRWGFDHMILSGIFRKYTMDVRSILPDRVVCLLLLMTAVHAIWVLEQPHGADQVLPRHPRFEWLCNEILYVLWLNTCCWTLAILGFPPFSLQVWKSAFWMAHYGQLCSKRSVFWGNSKEMMGSMVGKACLFQSHGTYVGYNIVARTKENLQRLTKKSFPWRPHVEHLVVFNCLCINDPVGAYFSAHLGTYTDSRGVKRFVGKKDELKKSGWGPHTCSPFKNLVNQPTQGVSRRPWQASAGPVASCPEPAQKDHASESATLEYQNWQRAFWKLEFGGYLARSWTLLSVSLPL